MCNLHGASQRMYGIKDIFEVSSYVVVKWRLFWQESWQMSQMLSTFTAV